MSNVDTWRVAHASQLPDAELPERYQHLIGAGIGHSDVRTVAMDYLVHFWELAEQGIAPGFFGRSGSYKTYAACAVAEHVRNKGLVPTLYVPASPEFSRLERRRFDATTEHRLECLVHTPFVILDDITDVKPGSFALDMLIDVIKQRDARGVPTLFTGNALFSRSDPATLVQHFGAPVTRRLLERTKGYLLVLR